MARTPSTHVDSNSPSIPLMGHNQPPAPDVSKMFAAAVKDQSIAENKGVTAEAKAALTILAWYDHRYATTSYADTLYKFSPDVGVDKQDKERRTVFMRELMGELKLAHPTLPKKGEARSDEYMEAKRIYDRDWQLLSRGMDLACALVQPDNLGMPGLFAADARSWFDDKANMFILPYERLLLRGEIPAGIMGIKVFGDRARKIEGDTAFRIALDGRNWTAQHEKSGELKHFKADRLRLLECAQSKRVNLEQETKNNKDGTKTTTIKAVPATSARKTTKADPGAKEAAAAAAAATLTRAPGGQAGDNAGSSSKELEFTKALQLACTSIENVLKEGPDTTLPVEEMFWTADPELAKLIERTMNALKEYKDRAIALEEKHKLNIAAMMARGAEAENAGSGKRLASH